MLRLQKNIKINFWLFFYPINYKRDLHEDSLIIMNKTGVIVFNYVTKYILNIITPVLFTANQSTETKTQQRIYEMS